MKELATVIPGSCFTLKEQIFSFERKRGRMNLKYFLLYFSFPLFYSSCVYILSSIPFPVFLRTKLNLLSTLSEVSSKIFIPSSHTVNSFSFSSLFFEIFSLSLKSALSFCKRCFSRSPHHFIRGGFLLSPPILIKQ